jgi:hypothetical protein
MNGERPISDLSDEQIAAQARAALSQPRDYVISADLDGGLCALLLSNLCGWRLAGFYDSRRRLWLREGLRPLEPSLWYVDVFIKAHQINCIDQHVVAEDLQVAARLQALGTKLNPQIAFPRAFESPGVPERTYFEKYPFGTCHWLIWLLELIGLQVPEFGTAPLVDRPSPLDLALRADDAARSTVIKYQRNTHNWWGALRRTGARTFGQLADRANSMTAPEVEALAKQVKAMGTDVLGGGGSDFNFSEFMAQPDRQAAAQARIALDYLARAFGLNSIPMPTRLVALIADGAPREIVRSSAEATALLSPDDVFSYGFVSGPPLPKREEKENLSLTRWAEFPSLRWPIVAQPRP